jgi:hypothetical protein
VEQPDIYPSELPFETAFSALSVEVKPGVLASFFTFFQTGFLLKAFVGCSVRDFLCEQLGLDEGYVAKRITTLFVGGKPVDDINLTIVKDGSTLSLSAAMPGLVGAAMRRNGPLAGLRSSITAEKKSASALSCGTGLVRIKLFNMVMHELGEDFLQKGIIIRVSELTHFLREQLEMFWHGITKIKLNGQPVEPNILTNVTTFSGSEWVFLSVYVRSKESDAICS